LSKYNIRWDPTSPVPPVTKTMGLIYSFRLDKFDQ
jgi:hypothetical protein